MRRVVFAWMAASLGGACGGIACPAGHELRGERCIPLATDGAVPDGALGDGGCAACPDRCASGTCVECVADAQCATGICEASRCAECRTSGDCAAGVCVDGACAECGSDGDCPGGVCEGGSCIECREDGDCGPGRVCASARCVECRVDDDCPDSAPRCDAEACVSCAGRTDCSAALQMREVRAILCRCLPGLGTFLGVWDTERGAAVEAGYCHPAGADGGQGRRMAGLAASLESGRATMDLTRLAALCDGDASAEEDGTVPDGGTCYTSNECALGRCNAGPAACPGTCTGGDGSSCASDFDCDSSLACAVGANRCGALPAVGQPCRTRCAESAHCTTGGMCAPRGGVGGACTFGSCQTGLYCSGGMCRALEPSGASCSSDLHCADGLYCASGRCTARPTDGQPCGPAGQCAEGHACHSGTCRSPRAEGEACSRYLGQCQARLRCVGMSCAQVGVLGEPCTAGTCARGLVCREGRCRGAPDVGETCITGETCLRGRCVGGSCEVQAIGSVCTSAFYPTRETDALDPCGIGASCYGDRCAADPTTDSGCMFDDECGPSLVCEPPRCARACLP